jgi:hypothetical protein
MTKRRKISEIYMDMNEINKRKPTEEELDELARVLNITEADDELPHKQIASTNAVEGELSGNESNRLQ